METKPVCPHCQSTLITRLGNQTHCLNCGQSSGLDRNPIATAAAARKAAASASTGFNRSHHERPGLEQVEQKLHEAESELRKASRAVLSCKLRGPEAARLREVERDAKAVHQRLLERRAELASAPRE